MFQIISIIFIGLILIQSSCSLHAQEVGNPSSLDADTVKRLINEAIIENNNQLYASPFMKSLDNLTAIFAHEQQKNESMKKDAKKAFDKAQKFADEGKIKDAGFYYAVACAADPEEGLYIFSYVKAVLNWADRMEKNGGYNASIASLYEMQNFLYSQAVSIHPRNSDSLIKLINDVENKIAYLRKEADVKVNNKDALSVNEIIKQAHDFVAADIPEGLHELELFYNTGEFLMERFAILSKSGLSTQAKDGVKQLSNKMKSVLNIIDTEKFLKKGNDILELLKDKSNALFASQLITEAAIIGQRLSLTGEGVMPDLQRRILKYGDDFIKISEKINQTASAAEFEKIKLKFDTATARFIKNETNAQNALQTISTLQDEIIASSNKVTDGEYIKKVRSLLTTAASEADKWREIQLKRYDVWGIKTVRKFYDTYKNEMGLLGSGSDTKDRIYAGMKDYLCPIEVRYLGSYGLRAYTEVFDFFYKELDRERRLELSSEFVSCEKRPLSFF